LIRSPPSLPTSRRLITCICVRCGIGIAITFLSNGAGKARAVRGRAYGHALARPCPAASSDAELEAADQPV
jgi:hypothetical protein